MEKEKRIDPADLPRPQTDLTTTQQEEEYIDKSNTAKDEGDVTGRKSGDSADDSRVPQKKNKDLESKD